MDKPGDTHGSYSWLDRYVFSKSAHDSSQAVSIPNGLLSQKYVTILTRATHLIVYCDLCKLDLV